jgi:hypothetical protein
MPSEEQIEVALKAVSGPIEEYRSAVVTTAEEVRGFLAHRQEDRNGGDVAAVGLGAFAAGRIDADRFANLLSDSRADDPDTLRKVEKAFNILRTASSGGDRAFYLKVKAGSRLRDAVADRLADRRVSNAGRAHERHGR